MISDGFITRAAFLKNVSQNTDGIQSDLHVEDTAMGPLGSDDVDTWVVSIYVEANGSFLNFTLYQAEQLVEAFQEITGRYKK